MRFTCRLALPVALLCCSSAITPALARNVSLAWSPVAGAAGYRVHVGEDSSPDAVGLDVGQPNPSPDGLIRYVFMGIANGHANSFAVTSYSPTDVQSALSNELWLSATSTVGSSPSAPQGSPPAPSPATSPAEVSAAGGLIRGGGARPGDCVSEFATAPLPRFGADHLPMNRLDCTDDDPSCDFGAAVGDHACTFHVGVCFNVSESRFPCVTSDVARVAIGDPLQINPRLATARVALDGVLVGLGGVSRGLCANRGTNRGHLCAFDADCNSAAGLSDGDCRGELVTFNPPLTSPERCTSFADITVPLRPMGTRFILNVQAVVLTATPSPDPITGRPRLGDRDSLTLVCHPHS